MRKSIGAGSLALAVAATALSLGLGPAQAASNTAALLTGGGTISPGLTTTPTFQTATFTGSATGGGKIGGKKVVFTGLACFFSVASSIAETVAKGKGGGSGGCSGIARVPGNLLTLSCGITYKRNAGVVTVNGACSASGVASGTASLTAALTFVPTTLNPTTSYLLVGSAVIR